MQKIGLLKKINAQCVNQEFFMIDYFTRISFNLFNLFIFIENQIFIYFIKNYINKNKDDLQLEF